MEVKDNLLTTDPTRLFKGENTCDFLHNTFKQNCYNSSNGLITRLFCAGIFLGGPMKSILFFTLLSSTAMATMEYTSGLKPEEQKYYKNEVNQGMNHVERVDSTVRELNKLHAEVASLKADVELLKNEVKKLKGKN